ncbi:MAG: hypothetical protein IKP79_03095 [Bacilli bacterium]|nr:hypothetical protein [Bacilli bacterium]
MALFDVKLEKYNQDKKYSMGLKVPQYLPTGVDVELSACYDKKKYNELVSIIDNSNLPDEKKAIYKLVATRFIDFNYANFAEYYANLKNSSDIAAAKEEQEIMEKLALVIVDIKDAIANGYVKLNSFIEDVLVKAKEEKNKRKESHSK